MAGLFDASFLRLETALVARERMIARIAANVANADTPNYHADRTSFAEMLAEVRAEYGLGPRPLAPLPREETHALRMDGNDVDLQDEMARLAEQQLMHAYTERLLRSRLDGILRLLREGR